MTTVDDLGTMALDDGGRVDFARLRSDRRARCLAQMAEHDLDVLVLGREANARFASGARRLWTAGTRPFAPSCVVVRESGDVHVLSTWDTGIPPEIDRSHLYGTTWNPAILTTEVAAIPGVAGARRIGVDGMTGRAAALLDAVAPRADVVDGTAAMLAARRTKSAGELACIRTAVAVAEAGIAAAAAHLAPGVRERHLTGRYLEAMASLGVTTPVSEGACCVTPRSADGALGDPPLRLVATDRQVETGDLVALSGGALYAGYAGVVARTRVCSGGSGDDAVDALGERWAALWAALAGALRPGATGADVLAAYTASGEPLPPFPIVHGVGLGMEPPVIGRDAHGGVLDDGMTVAVGGYVWRDGVGGMLVRDTVRITAGGPELLTRLS